MTTQPRGIGARLGGFVGSIVAGYRAAVGKSATGGWGGSYTVWDRAHGVAPDPRLTADLDRMATSDDVFAAVSLLANNAATVPLQVLRDGEPVPDHPLQVLLDRMNQIGGGRAAWQRAYQLLWLTGECFLKVERGFAFDATLPTELYPWSGQAIRPVPGTDRPLLAYHWRPNPDTTRPISLPVEDVVPVLLPHPQEPLRGLSPLSSLRMGLDAEHAAKRANRDLFRNALMTDAVLGIGSDNAQLRAQIKAEIESKRREGAHGILLVPDPVTVERLSLSPRDVEFLELDKLTTRDVAKAYLIPPMFLGHLEDATYSNYQQAERSLWQLAILPQVQRAADAVEWVLAPQYPDGDRLSVEPDTRGVEVLRRLDKDAAETIAELVNTQRIDPAWALERVTGEAPPPEAIVLSPAADAPKAAAAPHRKALRVKADRRRLARRVERAREPYLQRARELVDAALALTWERADAALAAFYGDDARATDGARTKAADDVEATIWQAIIAPGDPMAEALIALYGESIIGAAVVAEAVHDLEVDPTRLRDETAEWLRTETAAQVRQITDTLREDLRRAIETATVEGEGIEGIRRRVRDELRAADGETYHDRVEAIAQTEHSRAFGHGNYRAMQDAGITHQTWLYSQLPDSRHAAADGQVRRIGELFNINGYAARYPSDSSLPAGEAIRCKCAVVPSDDDEIAAYESALTAGGES